MEIGERTPLLSVRSSQRRVQSRRRQQQETEEEANPTGAPRQRHQHVGNNATRTAAAAASNFNDDDDRSSTSFRCGTDEQAGIWWSDDLSGSFLAVAVWISYGCVIWTIVSRTQQHVVFTALLCTTSALAVASHAKTALTDPGTVPRSAVVRSTNAYCALCQAGKPILAHHCRTCKRCICRMDHHCPWVKNCTYRLYVCN
jgi:DHHC palmitoyltransferase